MEIQLLAVPYDSGNRGLRMGAGPERLLDAGIQRALVDDGHRVFAKIAELPEHAWHAEIESGFELMRMLAGEVSAAKSQGRLPIVLAGNCNTSIGTVSGLGSDVAVAWFDAHADFNTPETTTSGFLDGTAVSILTGRCWKKLAASVGLNPVPDTQICLIGTRDIDQAEGELLEGARIDVITPANVRVELPRILAHMGEHVDDVYIHLDLDVLDASVAAANSYAVGGGMTVEDVEHALSLIARQFHTAAITLSAYDPAADSDGAAAIAAIRLVRTAARLAVHA
jgi:arginase